jgi:lactate dehydrogenase-like 2-hydroxyacid dehydrogenase
MKKQKFCDKKKILKIFLLLAKEGNYMKKLTVIGCGQVGAVLAESLRHRFQLRILESERQQSLSQKPWGWLRRITLQQPQRL